MIIVYLLIIIKNCYTTVSIDRMSVSNFIVHHTRKIIIILCRWEGVDEAIGPSTAMLAAASRARAPLTKEEWEKQQSILTRIIDPDTGRQRWASSRISFVGIFLQPPPNLFDTVHTCLCS